MPLGSHSKAIGIIKRSIGFDNVALRYGSSREVAGSAVGGKAPFKGEDPNFWTGANGGGMSMVPSVRRLPAPLPA